MMKQWSDVNGVADEKVMIMETVNPDYSGKCNFSKKRQTGMMINKENAKRVMRNNNVNVMTGINA